VNQTHAGKPMSKRKLSLPQSTIEILEYRRHRYYCPKCGGHSHAGRLVVDRASGQRNIPPAIKCCSFCDTRGDVSFDDIVASEASQVYIRRLLDMIRSEIKAGTDNAYSVAQTLVFLAFNAHNTAVDKSLVDQSHLTSEETLNEILGVYKSLAKHRKQAYEEDMAEACKATLAKLEEKVKAIAADADLRRRTLDAQKDIEERFGQRY
jgi:hypothetical protein